VSGLDSSIRRQIEQFVKPLYAGIDGVQTFDRVERLRARIESIRGDAGSAGLEQELLDLLLLLQGVTDRLGSLAPGGRLDLFLKGLGLPEGLIRRVRGGLGRLPDEPRGAEEELIHDALLLESAGVVATAGRLMAAGRKRTPVGRALGQLDPGPPAERYRTPRGAALGAARRRVAEEWIADLRRRLAEDAEGATGGAVS
jgi:hypothetical protein